MDRVISIFNILFLDMYAFLFTLLVFFGVMIGQHPVKRPTESTLEALLSGLDQTQKQQKVFNETLKKNNLLIENLTKKINDGK